MFSCSILNLVLGAVFLILSYFLLRKGTNMLNVPVNLRKFHGRKPEKSCPIDPYFLCGKILRNGIELRRDLYLSMRKLSNLSHFGNLSHGVFFSVEVFFGRRWPINITGTVTGNPRYHHLKNCIVLNCFKTLLQVTIVR